QKTVRTRAPHEANAPLDEASARRAVEGDAMNEHRVGRKHAQHIELRGFVRGSRISAFAGVDEPGHVPRSRGMRFTYAQRSVDRQGMGPSIASRYVQRKSRRRELRISRVVMQNRRHATQQI